MNFKYTSVFLIIAVASLIFVSGCIEEESESTEYICDYNAYNCADFSTHAQAQAAFEACGGVSNDIHNLDGDDDGQACESLP